MIRKQELKNLFLQILTSHPVDDPHWFTLKTIFKISIDIHYNIVTGLLHKACSQNYTMNS